MNQINVDGNEPIDPAALEREVFGDKAQQSVVDVSPIAFVDRDVLARFANVGFKRAEASEAAAKRGAQAILGRPPIE